MSPDDRDRQLLASELDQIRKELAILDRILGKRRRIERDQVQIHAAASCLHSIYNGMEKMLETALKTKGHSVKESPTSHSDLLTAAMSLGVISEEMAISLRSYMAFRHFYRHTYGFIIDNELLNPLLRRVAEVVETLAKELKVEPSGA